MGLTVGQKDTSQVVVGDGIEVVENRQGVIQGGVDLSEQGIGRDPNLVAGNGEQVGSIAKLVAAKAQGPMTLLTASAGEVDSPCASYPAGLDVQVSTIEKKDTITIAAGDNKGQEATLEWLHQKVVVNGKVLADTPDSAYEEMRAEFRSTFGDPASDWVPFTTGFDSSHSYSPFGSAGRMLSIREDMSYYSGGAHPSYGTDVVTFDLSTGKQVTLDELLSKKQFDAVVDTVAKELGKLEDGYIYGAGDDRAQMADAVKRNFGLHTAADGSVEIHVRLNSFVHAMAGMEAKVTFAAPTSAAFREKIGL